MAEIALSSVQTVLAALDVIEVKRIHSFLAYNSQIKDIRRTVTSIKNILKDAESSKEFTNTLQLHGYIQQLQDVIYEADDLFDEFVTQVELGKLSRSDTFFAKVSALFSTKGREICNKAQNIKKQLNDIALDRRFFIAFDKYHNKPISSREPETCSYINTKCNIVGRDVDKKAILDKLLEPNNQNVSFLTVVGVGGLGKTALAQLVFNDEKLKQEFGKEMFWVCVSDQFDVKRILLKILELVMGEKPSFDESSSMELVKQNFEKNLRGKKYFIVLDDVWNEDRDKWDDLHSSLISGQVGSKVLVTTRSQITAKVIEDKQPYMLQKLSREDSWKLFEMVAFEKDNNQQPSEKMVKIGEKIVDKCSNIPLAIKVVATLLWGEDISTWESFENKGLAEICNGDNKIMSVLKLSYHNLPSSLKSCFSYCALFPKDSEIEKGLLIKLWMAQGYIEPLHRHQSIEDAAEEHFNILLRRCFFQDVKKNKYDEIESVKIHDLMHDVAQEVGGGEAKVLSLDENSLGDRIRHVNILDRECFESSSTLTNLRTLLTKKILSFNAEGIQLGKWKSLRVLVLKYIHGGIKQNSFSELQHLRYLDLSHGDFRKLPKSTTELHNLQTLILNGCSFLKELPDDFSKLVKLTHLDLCYCKKLKQLPRDFGKLVKLTHLKLADCVELKQLPHDIGKLEKLSHLMLTGCNELIGMPLGLDRLEKLGALTKLVGNINIKIGEICSNVEVMKELSGAYLSKIPGLKEVEIGAKCNDAQAAEAALKKLEPHPNLKKLSLIMYGGRTIPWWRSAPIQLFNLVYIYIGFCDNLVTLPSFSKLPFLKTLRIYVLKNLEYMETRSNLIEASDTAFFPSLETIHIFRCEKWRGWFREDGCGDADYGCLGKLRFPCLSEVYIDGCPKLTSFPPCPSVKFITMVGGEKLSQLLKKMTGKEEEDQREVTVGNHTSSSSCLATLDIRVDHEMESLSEYEKVFETCASSLRELYIGSCDNLSRFSRGLEHLTALESLNIHWMDKLDFSEDNNEDIMAWEPLHQSLHSLSFDGLCNMKSLPEGMKHLTSLQTLKLRYCNKLKELPEWMSSLSSLQTLYLESCKELKELPEWISSLSSLQSLTIERCNAIKSLPQGIQTLTSLQTLEITTHFYALVERCRKDTGEDWQKIQHIPKLYIGLL